MKMNNPVIDLRYRELAAVIVGQACEDYCMSKRILKSKNVDKEKLNEAKKLNSECIDFFKSDRFRLFSNFEMSFEKLINRLDYLVDNDPRQFIRFYISREDAEYGVESEL